MEKKENKKMKKGLMIGALAVLLGVVGYTGGQTFAKYISTMETESATATVAQWGYTLSANASNLYGKQYVNDGSVSLATVDDEATAEIVVQGTSGDKVAPGTTGKATFSVQGQAEVLSKLTVDSTVTDISLSDGTNTYLPLKWSVTGTAKVGDTNHLTSDIQNGTAKQVQLFLNGLSTAIIPVNTVVDIDLTISWEWAFDGVTSTPVLDLFTADASDTLTGDEADTVLANGGVHYNGSETNVLSGSYTLVKETSFTLNAFVQQIAHD